MKKSLLVAAALMSLFLAACNDKNETPAASAASEVSAPTTASEAAPASEPTPAPASEVSAPAVASEASAASN
ncbi:hypothetical protein [Snodgrassella sp. M0351]|uniref:hypothetical protein n=1 Tax=Snodgrassella sp. M0351 TaxID=2751012 RepID=UPI0018DEC552|nr:hypothetical protein [Snodgrassella sp. M0351]MBI0165258.1 hypothetical protein [Snodgrassella sp. M0351]